MADEWDEIAAKVQATSSTLASNNIAMQKRNPALVARAQRVAARFGVSSPLVEEDPETYDAMDMRQQTDAFLDDNPWAIAHFVQNPDAAAMVQAEDLIKLGSMGSIFGMKSTPVPQAPVAKPVQPEAPLRGFRDLMVSGAQRIIGALANPVSLISGFATDTGHKAGEKAGEAVVQDFRSSGLTAPQYAGRIAKTLPNAVGLGIVNTAAGVLGTGRSVEDALFGLTGRENPYNAWYKQQQEVADATNRLYTPKWIEGSDVAQGIFGGVQSLTSMLLTLPLGEGALWGLGAQTYGQAYSQFRERGAGIIPSLLGAAAEGAIEIGTERYMGGFGKGTGKFIGNNFITSGDFLHPTFKKMFNFIWQEHVGEQVATFGQNLVDFAVPGSDIKNWGEFWKQAPSQAWQTFWAVNTMVGALGATGASLNAMHKALGGHKDAVEGLHGQAILDEVMKNAEDAPMRKLSPTEFAKTVNASAAESPVKNVFIPVEAIDKVLADENIPDDEKAALTVYQDQIEEARVNNGDVVIPIGEAAAHLSGTKIWEAVRDDARVLAGGISGREARENMDKLIDTLEQASTQAVDELNEVQPAAKVKQQVYEEVKAQVVGAGRTEREAQTTAALLASRAEALASDRYGQFKDAGEAWQWMKLRIQGQPVKGGKKVAQAQPKAVVNIGLDVNDGSKLTVNEAVKALRDQGVDITAQEVRQSGTEPTLIATLDKPLTPEQANAVSSALRQDAIAQRVGDTGELYGPAAAKWGPFNPDYFLEPTESNRGAGWTEQRVDGLIRAFGYPDGTSKAYAVTMSPDEFLGLTASAEGRRLIAERVENMPEYGQLDLDILRASNPPMLIIHLAREPSNVQKQMGVERLRDLVMGHEGRHRAMMMKRDGIESFPVVLLVEKVKPGDKATGPTTLDLNPQRSRSDQVGTGDQPVIGREAIPISDKYRDMLQGMGGQTLFQAAAIGGYEGLAQHLTSEEKVGLREASKKKIMSIVESLPDAEEMAAVAFAGRAKRGWYENSAQAILDVFGAADAPRFAALLAALSPQTSVQSNLFNAIQTWTNWNNAGRPTERRAIVKIMGQSVQGGKGVGSILNTWINNSVTALSHPNPGQIKLSGPKVDSFMNNLLGVVDEVTNDTWMANYANVDPVLFRKTGQNKGPGYKAMNAVVRKAADILTEKTGEYWTPAEVQETVWSFAKTLYEMRDVAGETRSMQALLEAGQVTHNDIANTPDFGVLFSDGIYKTILEQNGYDTGSLGSNRRAVGVNGQETIRQAPEGSGFAPDDFQRFLAQAAHRLEIVRQRRRGTVAEDQYSFPFEEGLSSKANGELEPLTLQQFGGEIAAASDPERMTQLERAKAESHIFSPEELWERYGWTKGAEGKWRFEIHDFDAKLKTLPSPKIVEGTNGIQPMWLDEVLDHQQLFRWYPQLRRFTVIADPSLGHRDHGYFDFSKNMIGLNLQDNRSDHQVLSTLLHEVQHAIQQSEGFAVGGPSSERGLRLLGLGEPLDWLIDYYRKVNRGEIPGKQFQTVKTDEELRDGAAYEIYDRLAGEIEARNIEERMNLQPDLLRMVHPDLDPQLGMVEYPMSQRIVILPEDVQAALAQSVDRPTPERPTTVQQPTPPPRGETTFYPGGDTVVTLFGRADFSTMLHEMSHVFLQQEFELAKADGASQQLKDDIAALTKWFEANGGAVVNGMPDVASHELFARTGELYFREGKAPSAELRGAFKQFRQWLTGVYKSVKALTAYGPAPINAEIRDIMDRMIATQEAIDYNATQPMSQEELGMTEAEYKAYLDSFDEALDTAHDTLLEKMMAAIRRRNQKEMREQRANVKEEVRKRVNAEPRFVALHLLRTGRWLGDPERERVDIKINTGWLIDNYGDEILNQLPRGLQAIHRGDGQLGDDIAAMTGLASGDALVKALVEIKADAEARKAQGDGEPLRDKLVTDETDRIMAERHGDIAMSDDEIREEAIAALNSTRQGEILATELRQLRKKSGAPGVITPYQILREWARRKAQESRVGDVTAKSTLAHYTRLIEKARNAAEKAILAGDTNEAIKQKQAQMINHALLAESKKVADELNVVIRRMQRYAKTKAMASIDQDYMDRIHELVEAYDFRTVSEVRLAEKASFEEWAKGQRDQGQEVYVPPRFRDDRTNYKDASVAKLLELNDMVQSLAYLGKLKQELIFAGEQRRLDEMRDEAEASVLALPERRLGDTSVNEIRKPLRQQIHEAKTFADYARAIGSLFRPGSRVRQAAAGLVKIEGVADILDQTKMGVGPFNRMLIRGSTNAINEYTRIKEEVMDVITDAYHSMSGKMAARLNDHVTIPELTLNAGLHPEDPRRGKPLNITRKQLLALVANTGNLSNLSKLGVGEGWVEDGESMVELTRLQQTLIGYLNKEEMDLVQAFWSGMGKLWPHIVRVERQMTGIVPEAVVPMDVETPWGTYKGGYWPVVWDSDRTDMGKPDEETTEANLFGVGSGLTTFKGHTITRTGAAAPMDWSLDRVLFSRTNQIISRIAYAPWIRDTLKLLNSPRVSGSIRLRLGNEYLGAIKQWMRDQIPSNTVSVAGAKWWENLLTSMRVNMTATVLGISYTTGLAQVLGLTYSAGVLGEGNPAAGPKWLAVGFKEMLRRYIPGQTGPQEFVFTRSEEMRRRAHELNREVREVFSRLGARNLNAAQRAQRWIQAKTFWHIAFIDLNLVSIPTWYGGYEKAKAQGLSEEDAAAYADKAVRLSQGTGREKDMSAIQRGNAGQRFIAMFYTPSSVFFNSQWESVQQMKAGNWSKALAPTFWFLVANTLADAYRSGDWPPEDDEGNVDIESVSKWVARNLLFGLFYGVPVARDITNTANRELRGQYAEWGSTPLSYGLESIGKGFAAVAKIPDEEKDVEGRDIKNISTAIGFTLGLPGAQTGKTGGFLYDVETGKEQPEGVKDWFDGLTKGKVDTPGKEKPKHSGSYQ